MDTWEGINRRHIAGRRQRHDYRFLERRTGFDRRRRYPVLDTMRDHPWILIFMLVAMNILSLADGLFTAAEMGMGIASEGNPVLNAALQEHPLLAIAIKVGALLLVSAGIWHGRHNRAIIMLAPIALGIFAAVVAYHTGTLYGLGLL